MSRQSLVTGLVLQCKCHHGHSKDGNDNVERFTTEGSRRLERWEPVWLPAMLMKLLLLSDVLKSELQPALALREIE